MNPHPMQEVIRDQAGIPRFRQNKLVRFLKDASGYDLNTLATMDFSAEDWMQFSQLLGYSVCGYGELFYATPESVAEADRRADLLPKPVVDEVSGVRVR